MGESLLHRPERASARGPMLAIGVVFLGSLSVLIAAGRLRSIGAGWPALVTHPLLVLVGACGALSLGPGALRASLGRLFGARELGLGLGAGLLAFALNWTFVVALRSAVGARAVPLEGSLPLAVAGLVVLPAVVEEWLFRGVIWVASRRALGPLPSVVLGAALFALLHFLNGFLAWELPHRFVFGLLLGALRARTGSLAPCILAHAVGNGLALALAWRGD